MVLVRRYVHHMQGRPRVGPDRRPASRARNAVSGPGPDLTRGRLDRHRTRHDRRGAARRRHDGDRHGDRDRLHHPHLGGQVGVVKQAARERGPAGRCASRRRTARRAGRPSARSATPAASRTALTLRVVERRRVPAARVVQVRPATGHPGPEVGADRAEDDDGPAGHVLAAVRADPLDDGLGAAVADREAHPGPTDEVQPAAGRAVQARCCRRSPRRGVGGEVRLGHDRDRAARQALAHVVVGLADEPQLHARARRTPRTTGRPRRELRRIGPWSSPRSRAPVSAAPRTSGRRSSRARPGRGDRALAAERRGDAASSARGRRVADVAAGGPAGSRAACRRGAATTGHR